MRQDVLATGLFGEDPVRGYIERDGGSFDRLSILSNERWTFVQCCECGTKFHRQAMSESWNNRRYNEWQTEADIRIWVEQRGGAQFNTLWARSREYVQHLLRLEKLTRSIRNDAPRLLDFGCGFGEFVRLARSMCFDAVGVDRAYAKKSSDIVADLDEVSGRYHAITLFEVLEHLEEPLPLLRRLVADFLEPEGVVVLESPNCESVEGISADPVTYDLIHPLEHINAFTPDTMQKIAERAGLTPIDKPFAIVATDLQRAAKDVAVRLKRPTTRQYFRRKS